MDPDFHQIIFSQPRLRLGLVLYSGYHPCPWAITIYYVCHDVADVSLHVYLLCRMAVGN